MIFCEIDEQFCTHMKKYARGRLLVDCGAGEALFQQMMPRSSVLSLDLRIQTDQVAVLQKDYREFEFARSTIPIFIRPCHAAQVHETIVRNLDTVDAFLYVSRPDNVEVDLSLDDDYGYAANRIFPEWEGADGEHIFEVISERREVMSNKQKYVLVQDGHCNMRSWHEALDEDGKLVNTSGGYCFLNKGDKILETVEAEDFQDLDWTKTSVLVKDTVCGWLNRDGKFYGCHSQDHDFVAYYVIKKEVAELEKAGWVRLDDPPKGFSTGHRHGLRLSAEQRNWMSEHGYIVGDD